MIDPARTHIQKKFRAFRNEQNERDHVTIRARQDKMVRDYHGAEAGKRHPLLTPDWRVTMEKRRIHEKLWLHNPDMLRSNRYA